METKEPFSFEAGTAITIARKIGMTLFTGSRFKMLHGSNNIANKETIQIFLKHVIEMLNTEMENRILQLVYTPLLTLEEEEDKLRLELCRIQNEFMKMIELRKISFRLQQVSIYPKITPELSAYYTGKYDLFWNSLSTDIPIMKLQTS